MGIPFLGGDDDDDSPDTPIRSEPKAIELDEELVQEMREREIAAGPVLNLTPYRRPRDVDTSKSFFRDVFVCERDGPKLRQNHSVPFAFEPYYDPDEGTIGFRYVADTARVRTEVRQGLESAYHDSDINQEPPQFVDAEPGQYLSIARLTLRDPEALKPINNPDINPGDFDPDPYESITRRMAGGGDRDDAQVVTQMMFMPAISHANSTEASGDNRDLNWHHGVEDVAQDLREAETAIRWAALPELFLDAISDSNEEVETIKEREPGGKAEEAASLVENQKNQEGYHINVRTVAVADSEDVAKTRVERVAAKYGNFYNSTSGQGFRPVYDVDVRELARKAARRSWVDRGIPFGLGEAVALGAPPTNLSTPEVGQTHRSSDQGTPAGNPDFGEFDETGYTDEWEGGR